MPNTVTIRVITDGAKESAQDLDALRESAQDMGDTAKDSLKQVEDQAGDTGDALRGAGDDAESAGDDFKEAADKTDRLKDKLHGVRDAASHLDKSTIKGLTGALDAMIGTDFKPLVTNLLDLGELAEDLGGVFEDQIHEGLDKVAKSGPIKAAAEAVGAVTGAAEAAAHEAAATGSAAVKSLAAKVAAMQIPLAASGTTVGTAIGGAISAGIVAGMAGAGALALATPAIVQKLTGTDPSSQIYQGGRHLADKFMGGASDQIKDQYAQVFSAAVDDALKRGLSGQAAGQAGVDAANLFAQSMGYTIAQDLPPVIRNGFNVSVTPAATAAGTSTGTALGVSVSRSFSDNIDLETPMDTALGNVADTIRNSKQVVGDAMDDLIYVMEHPLEIAADKAAVAGALMGQQLADGLASKDPVVHAQAVSTYNQLAAQWQRLTGNAWSAGAAAGVRYMAGLNSHIGQINNPFYHKKGKGNEGMHAGGGGRASGGPVAAGVAYTVGEHGSETFVPNQNGTIVPHGAGAGIVIQILGPVYGGPAGLDQLARDISARLRQTTRGAMRGSALI